MLVVFFLYKEFCENKGKCSTSLNTFKGACYNNLNILHSLDIYSEGSNQKPQRRMIQLLLHLKLHSTVHVVTYWEMTHPLVCKVIVLTSHQKDHRHLQL